QQRFQLFLRQSRAVGLAVGQQRLRVAQRNRRIVRGLRAQRGVVSQRVGAMSGGEFGVGQTQLQRVAGRRRRQQLPENLDRLLRVPRALQGQCVTVTVRGRGEIAATREIARVVGHHVV